MASRHLQEVAAYAPLRLHIHEVEGAPRPKFSHGVSLVQQTLHGVSRHFKGAQHRLFVFCTSSHLWVSLLIVLALALQVFTC